MTAADPIRAQARRTPEALAYVGHPRRIELTYAALDRLVDAVALRALAAGVQPGQTAIVALAAPLAIAVTMVALARIGVASAARTLPDRFADVRLVAEASPGAAIREVVVHEDWFAAAPGAASDRLPAPGGGAATWAIFGTSGTTGAPRHFAITHDMLARRVAIAARTVPMPALPRQLTRIGLQTAYGALRLISVLGAGGLVAFPEDRDVPASLRARALNMLVMAPADIARFLHLLPADARAFPDLAVVVLAGSIVPRPLYDEIRARLCRCVRIAYGATEVGPTAGGTLDELIDAPGAVGVVDRDCDVQCVDDDGRPVPPGAAGTIRIRREPGAGIYLDDPAASLRAFRGEWFHPGDVGVLTADRRLRIVGRTDELINIGGDTLSPHAIEERVLALGAVRETAAFVVPDAQGIPQPWIAVVPGPGLDVESLAARCTQAGAVPPGTRFVALPALPRNAAGKVVRDELVRLVAARGRDWPRAPTPP